jgi:hypothetical protein
MDKRSGSAGREADSVMGKTCGVKTCAIVVEAMDKLKRHAREIPLCHLHRLPTMF